MKESLSVLHKTYQVEREDIDFSSHIKMSALFRNLQDAASVHAEKLGLGFLPLTQSLDATWVLVRIRVEIERMPSLHEKITVKTWPLTPRSLQFDRDFLLFDEQGRAVVRAVSVWSLMDRKSRKIRRSDIVAKRFPIAHTERAIDIFLGKLKPAGSLEYVYNRMIAYNDLDLNEHLNNARYVDFVMDCFTLEEHRRYHVSSIEMTFMREALPGQNMAFRKNVSLGTRKMVFIEGTMDESDQAVFRCQVTLRLKNGEDETVNTT